MIRSGQRRTQTLQITKLHRRQPQGLPQTKLQVKILLFCCNMCVILIALRYLGFSRNYVKDINGHTVCPGPLCLPKLPLLQNSRWRPKIPGRIMLNPILGDPGAASRDDRMFVVKVYYKNVVNFTTNILSSRLAARPCIRRGLLKFKLTNQNSASGKNCAIRRHINRLQLKGQKTI